MKFINKNKNQNHKSNESIWCGKFNSFIQKIRKYKEKWHRNKNRGF